MFRKYKIVKEKRRKKQYAKDIILQESVRERERGRRGIRRDGERERISR